MAKDYDFCKDALLRSERCNMQWYQKYLCRVLEKSKENRARDIDISIGLARDLVQVLNEKVHPPKEVPLTEVEHRGDDDSLMKPIEQEVVDRFYNSTEKGGDFAYLKERNKKSPEEKFYFRIVTSWDYGWNQKASKLLGKDVHHGREALLKETFYRKNNLAPDPPHYAQPAGAEVSICSEYSCNAN